MRGKLTALAVAAVACSATGSEALAATSLGVEVRPATPGTAAAPIPVTVAVRAAFSDEAGGALPTGTRALAISMPDGFATALDGTVPCVRADLAARGSVACTPQSKLGAGGASFVYIAGALRIPASTEELSLFRGDAGGDAILLYLRVTRPVALSAVVPGTLTTRPAPAGPLMTFDLSAVAAQAGGGSVAVTQAFFDLTRGLAAGPCPATGAWKFLARLEYVDGRAEERSAEARCDGAPDTTAPQLRASARSGPASSGARISVSLSEPASVRVVLERAARGRWVAVRRVTLVTPAGASVLRIRRAGAGGLPRGRYRARLRATDAAGLASASRSVTFTLR